jgi:peptidoglycan/xylan/chitin deacetylase (PgdA/CDA1 family)
MSVPVHIPVLLYHQVNDKPSATTTPPDVFRSHMEWLADNGWRSLRLDEFEAAVEGNQAPGHRSFLLTYDDGSADLSRCAVEMERCGFSGTAFLITGRQRAGDPASLSTEEVARLASQGTFEFQSHTERHVRVSPDQAGLDGLANDLIRSRDWLMENLNVPEKSVRHLAWPWGQCTPAMESLANELGFGWQYLVQRGAVTHGSRQVRLPRLCADGMSLSQFSRWMTVMGSRPGGQLVNHVFGPIRRVRHGLAYW